MPTTPPRRPALPLALAALSGAALGAQVPLPFSLLLALVSLVLALRFLRRPCAVLLLLTAAVAAFATHARLEHLALSPRPCPKGTPTRLEGRVTQAPQRLRGRWRVVLDTEQGLVDLEVGSLGPGNLLPGARVVAMGRFRPWAAPRDPGGGSLARVRAREGIFFRFAAGELTQVLPGTGLGASLASCRRHWRRQITRGVPSEHRGFYLATLLGERGEMSSEQRSLFARTGTAHLLSISGLHVGLVLGGLLLLLRSLGVGPGLQRVAGLLCLVLLVLVVGPRVPIVRATVAGGVFLLTPDRGDGWNRLSVALLAVLVWDPLAPSEIGCQLSFGTVAGILALAPLVRRVRGWRKFVTGAAVPFAASTPLLATCFGTLPLVALLIGAPCVFLFSLVLAVSVAGLTVGVLVPELGAALLSASSVGVHLLFGLVAWSASLPGASLGIAQPAAWAVVLALGLLALGLVRLERGRPARAHMAFGGLLLLTLVLPRPVASRPCLRVLVRNNGRTVLVDPGRGPVLGFGHPRGEPRWLRHAINSLGAPGIVWFSEGRRLALPPGVRLRVLAPGAVLLTAPSGRLIVVRRGQDPTRALEAVGRGALRVDLLVAPGVAVGRLRAAHVGRAVGGKGPLDLTLRRPSP